MKIRIFTISCLRVFFSMPPKKLVRYKDVNSSIQNFLSLVITTIQLRLNFIYLSNIPAHDWSRASMVKKINYESPLNI